MKFHARLSLATLALLGITSVRAAEMPAFGNAIYASPMGMILHSAMLDMPVISIAYEISLSQSGLSLFVPLHAGYLQNADKLDAAFGSGLGLRKYFGDRFSGSYLTAQSDFISHYFRGDRYVEAKWDGSGNLISSAYNSYGAHRDYLSITQLSFGYKWLWRQFTLDLSGGGAFYAKEEEKYTNFIGSANVGFPFNKETFGF